MRKLKKISSCLWFDKNAEEAVQFYTSVFKNSSTGRVSHYTKEAKEVHGMDEGTVLTIEFTLEDEDFLALNAGPIFKFNEAVSFIVYCDTQDEIDYYWERLGEGGDPKAQQCGWLKDKFGLSWQITPYIMPEIFAGTDSAKAERVMRVMMQMKKLDIAALENA